MQILSSRVSSSVARLLAGERSLSIGSSDDKRLEETRKPEIQTLEVGSEPKNETMDEADTVSSKKGNETSEEVKLPEDPTTCCMSGCANCVWIQYAEEMSKRFKDGGTKARKIIIEQVQDPNMRAFLLMELRLLEKKLSQE